MKLLNIIEEIEKADVEFAERISTRRTAFRNFAGFGSKVALSALPLALGSLFKKAYGASTDTVEGVLQYALTLEYLESDFYSKGLSVNPALIPSADRAAFTTISNHETAHVKFLQDTLKTLGATPASKPAFDFTAKGNFADVFVNYDTFLAVSQTFEDTGVRAYKGQAPAIVGGGDVLTAALNIHSVEARHASHVRWIRKSKGADVKPWITLNQSGIGAAVATSYAGEENVKQAEINITNINGKAISAEAASEAFDEPLTKDQVIAIVTPFFA